MNNALIIPIRNEEKNIEQTLQLLHKDISSNLISNCLAKEKDQTGLILSPRKITAMRRKSVRVAGFLEEIHKAGSS